MIAAIVADILSAVTGISGVKTIDPWTGDVKALIEKPQMMPGIYATYSGCRYGDPVSIGGSAGVDINQRYTVLVVTSSARGPSDAASMAWSIIEAIRPRLIARKISTYGRLWPVSEDLVYSDGLIQVYGLDYYMDTRI